MTTEALYVKKGDIGIPITATLRDRTGTVVNLTGAAVDFIMALRRRGLPITPPKVNADAVIVSPTLGTVSYTTVANDLNTVGTYFVEWEVTFAGGGVQRFPGDGFDKIAVGSSNE